MPLLIQKKSEKSCSNRNKAHTHVKMQWKLLKYWACSTVQHTTYCFAAFAPKFSHSTEVKTLFACTPPWKGFWLFPETARHDNFLVQQKILKNTST